MIERVPPGYSVSVEGEDVLGLEVLGTAQIKRRVHHRDGRDFEYPSESYTTLCWACLFANFTAVAKLVDAGADINSTASEDGTTALMAIGSRTSPDYTLNYASEESKIVNLLLWKGASFDVQDADGNTALHLCCRKPLILTDFLTGYYSFRKMAKSTSIATAGTSSIAAHFIYLKLRPYGKYYEQYQIKRPFH